MASVHGIPPKKCLAGDGRPCYCSDAIARSGRQSSINDRHRPRPAGGTAAHLHRKAAHQEALGRQGFEIVQLFDMAIADFASGTMAFPDQLGIVSLGVFLLGVDERRVPAPAICLLYTSDA